MVDHCFRISIVFGVLSGLLLFNDNKNKIHRTDKHVNLPIASDTKSNINNIKEINHDSWISSEKIALTNTKNIKKAPSETAVNKSIDDLNKICRSR